VVVAPATAHLLARVAHGLADDLLTATLLATRAPVLVCPAMHTEMWEQPSVQENVATLRRRGWFVLGPDDGPLAGGDSGPGRLVDNARIVAAVDGILGLGERGVLTGKHVVVTAGGTREPIDAVRVISNRSSGRQGSAIATIAARMGANVTLVTAAPAQLAPDVATRISVVPVDTAAQMADAVLSRSDGADVIVMAAAVADFTVTAASEKLKKELGPPTITLEPTLDILLTLGQRRRDDQVIVGFAAETNDALASGLAKRRRKHCDLMVVNDVSQPGVGFDHPTNAVWLIDRDDLVTEVTLRSKEEVAQVILTNVARMLERGAR
jgi:phosphopantothenoylcysteine decarboxylase/phosphopantothenate--cysteine ligase